MVSIKMICISTSILLISHWSEAATLKDSYLFLDNYIRNSDPIKLKLPASHVAGDNRLLLHAEVLQVQSVNEVNQAAQLIAVLFISWRYTDLSWDPADHNNISSMPIDTADLWLPQLLIPKSAGDFELHMPSSVNIQNTGSIFAVVPTRLEISCNLDFRNYPFDEHNCSISFADLNGIGVYHSQELDMGLGAMETYIMTSTEWILGSQRCASVQALVNITECWFVMKRQSIFYVFTLIFPIVSMSTMTLLVFCLPASTGEKVSFIISIFLSMSFFINFVVGVIPRSVYQLPRIVSLIVAVILLIMLSGAATAVVLHKYNHEEKKKSLSLQHLQKRNAELEDIIHAFKSPFSSQKVPQDKDDVNLLKLTSQPRTIDVNKGSKPLYEDALNMTENQNKKIDVLDGHHNKVHDVKPAEQTTWPQKRHPLKMFVRQRLWDEVSHGRMDVLFFWLFLLLNVFVYCTTWLIH